MVRIKGRRRVVIMGAGGRDFHNFNIVYRHDPAFEVVAFTATQIPFQTGRRYPSSLAGSLYPEGIPIVGEEDLPSLIRSRTVDEVVFAYSDVSHLEIMRTASRVLAAGADFRLLGPGSTMLSARIPVISVCAIRTGCGKSPVTRYLCRLLLAMGRRPVVVRHPMAYGRLDIREVERFASSQDLDRFQCTLEEREEYEPLIRLGVPLFAGVDYEMVLGQAQEEGDVLIWDGGNNDFSFFRSDLEIVLLDPFRAGDEISYYPGMVNLLRAGIVILAKTEGATPGNLEMIRENLRRYNPAAMVVPGRLEVMVADPEAIRGKVVAVVEDGPTLTHGGMAFGAGVMAARRCGAAEIADPRPFASGSLSEVYQDYPHLERVIPAMGYSQSQVADLKATLEAVPCDLVLSATPVNLAELLRLSRPLVRVTYEFRELEENSLGSRIRDLFGKGN